MTTFKVGDIIKPIIGNEIENEDHYWLVKRVCLLMTGPVYDLENIRNGRKVFSIKADHCEKIP